MNTAKYDRYGHYAALAEYAGLDGSCPNPGFVQHGWQTGTGFSQTGSEGRLFRLAPKFVWNSENLTKARSSGLKAIVPIGAPFIYQTELMKDVCIPVDRGTIFFPFHSAEGTRLIGDHSALADAIHEAAGDDPTVCLYWREYENPAVRSAYEAQSTRVITMGRPHQEGFLQRLFAEISRHNTVATNAVSSALWYGAYLGRNVQLIGPPMHLAESSNVQRTTDGYRARWPELYRDGLSGARAQTVASIELGHEWLRDSRDLRALLGWSGIRRGRTLLVSIGYSLSQLRQQWQSKPR